VEVGMRYQDLKEIERGEKNAPIEGYMLAYFPVKKVLFCPYHSLQEVVEVLGEEEILELHLFDRTKEYRAISTVSKRFPDGVIETVADFSEEEAYSETVCLERQFADVGAGKIRILNHIAYDRKGMACVDNYRLQIEA